MSSKSLEEVVKELGFESEKEFHKLVASIGFDLMGEARFTEWQLNDGSKNGLLKIHKTVIKECLRKWLKGKFLPDGFDWKKNVDETSDVIKITLYTATHSYHIVAQSTYLGATCSERMPRAGEDWTRGSDLADGRFCEDTFQKIIYDIVSNELIMPVAKKNKGTKT